MTAAGLVALLPLLLVAAASVVVMIAVAVGRNHAVAFGLTLAGLAASGETEIIGLEYIDRGYERLEESLSALGAQVQRSSGVIPEMEPNGAFETSEYPAFS